MILSRESHGLVFPSPAERTLGQRRGRMWEQAPGSLGSLMGDGACSLWRSAPYVSASHDVAAPCADSQD
jgi:hypothetical protein